MKSLPQDDEYEVVGVLERSSTGTGRWAIITADGRNIEITSGEVIEVCIQGHWLRTRIECGSAGYYAVEDGVQLCRGLRVRQ